MSEEATSMNPAEFINAAEAVKRLAQQYAHMQRAAAALERVGSLANTVAELETAVTKKREQVASLEASIVAFQREAEEAKAKAGEIIAQATADGAVELASAKARAKSLVDNAQARATTVVSEAEKKADEITTAASRKVVELQAAAASLAERIEVDAKKLDEIAIQASEARDVIDRAERIRSAMA